MFLGSRTLLAGHDHLITPNTEFLMGHYGRPFSGSGSVSANRWNRVLSGHRLQRQNISTDPHLYPVCQMKKATGDKSLLLPYQRRILTPNVLVEWLRDGRYLSKAINLFQGEAKANFNSPQRICWYNRLHRAALLPHRAPVCHWTCLYCITDSILFKCTLVIRAYSNYREWLH